MARPEGRDRFVVVWLVWVAALLTGCRGGAVEHETLGDRAYADGRFAEALVEYRLAVTQGSPDPGLRLKAAVAALHAGDLAAAADEFVALAAEGGDARHAEAAGGLVRVADRALELGDANAVARSLGALEQVAPGWAYEAYAQELAELLGPAPRSIEALSVLTYASANAPDARLQDSIMFGYAGTLRRMGRCEEALPAFESVARRGREPVVAGAARDGATHCALALGRRALDAGQPSEAETWFERAAAGGGDTRAGRAAYLGLGDVRFAHGDYVGAAEAYVQATADGTAQDSIARVAVERLNLLGRAETETP